MQQDKLKWNKRFSQRANTVPTAPAFITQVSNRLKPGTVLDLASGDGAAALYLAGQGFNVTAVDISDVALTRLQGFAQELKLSVTTVPLDVDQPAALGELGVFDNIVITHFKPEHSLWPLLASMVGVDGKVALTTFNLAHHQKNGFSRRFCLAADELKTVSDDLVLEHYGTAVRDGDYMDDYLLRKC